MAGEDAEGAIISAYISARELIKNPAFDSINPHFHNEFASLKSVMNSIADATKTLGITYQQRLCARDNGKAYLETYLVGESGKCPLSEVEISIPPNPQAFGSELTYKRRYLAMLDWGIVGDKDDDGESITQANESASKPVSNAQSRSNTQNAEAAITEPQTNRYARLEGLIEQCINAGIKKTGIAQYLNTTFVTRAGAPKKKEQYSDSDLKQAESYLEGLLHDIRQLKINTEV